MSVYIISNDIFLESGIIELANELNIDAIPIKIKDLSLEKLKRNDSIIINLNLKNKSCSTEITKIYNKCKVMVLLNSQREIIISQSDITINSRSSLSIIKTAIYQLVNMEKVNYNAKKSLSNMELKIISEALKGIDIDVIARNSYLTQKQVYTYRNTACKKLGGKRVNDLLLISDSLINNTSQF